MHTPFPRTALDASIPALFAERARTHADRVAIRFRGEEIRYRELAERASGVSSWLQRTMGPTPGAVALALPQGIDLVVAMLGVLESGNWYVPLDPTASPDRLRDALELAEATIVITNDATYERAAEACSGSRRVMRISADMTDAVPVRETPPDALAYVYFTSGTSGPPKGVMDSHRNVLHNILRYTNTLQIDTTDRLTLIQAPTFSGAVSNVFGALLNGATLLIHDTATEGAGTTLARWIQSEGATIYHSVPSIFRTICTEGQVFPTIRIVRLEGDAAAPGDVAIFRTHFPAEARLVNGLGTTETGLCCQFFVDAQSPVPVGALPVGRPVEDCEVRVVDPTGADVATGAMGEIVVRSPYLALGYWRDEARTAAAFTDDGRGRAYHTGDLGRVNADGMLEHLGRLDHRLKVAGMWVDVPAIEAAVAELDSVRQVAVTLEHRDGREPVLAAYVVPANSTPPTYDALREALEPRFASHEIPSRAWTVVELPTTPHGKIDRRALSTLQGARLKHEGRHVAPRGNIETTLAAIWREVLQLERVGVEDDFVHLGGTSLQAVHVAMEIEKRLGKQVALTDLMEAPTIAALAPVIAASAPSPSAASLITVQPRGHATPLFCVHDLESDAFLFAQLSRALGDEQPLYALRYAGAETLDRVPRTLDALAARYIHDLKTIQPHGPYRIAGFCYGAVVALAMARALRAEGEESVHLTLFNVTPHDLSTLVSPASQIRFRSDWAARARYVRAKPDRLSWLGRKLSRRIRDVVWRHYLPWADRLTPEDEVPSPEHTRAILLHAFATCAAMPFDGPVTAFIAAETLPLYADDAREAWAGLTQGELEVHMSPRDGYRMLVEPDVREVAAHLSAGLRAQPS